MQSASLSVFRFYFQTLPQTEAISIVCQELTWFERNAHIHTTHWNYTNVMIVFIDTVFANLD